MTSCANIRPSGMLCANTAVSVILVRTYEEHSRYFPLPKYWVLATCTDCKPQFMAEYRDHDTITATIDVPDTSDTSDTTICLPGNRALEAHQEGVVR